ncbi:DUF1828 domain-containing protein [Altererythrobacter confluentis]|uniref:DUF1828 domain-containing protein n=1 Tax=Allopontixanthobacter confluentis TaxID=1849021 RepID=A0A6L7GG36_9SPHN|nr:DUF1828 domain-containing protein [Allopontixanthobacter confluentis]MXP14859.1 DUF1828 domain-containing protein [Allopontixanthobacter confluentis]
MNSSELSSLLCRSFCEEITVRNVPSGLAISTAFSDASGDRISFYAVETNDGWRLEDDGDYLAGLIARDVPIMDGIRSTLLDGILAEGGAHWDQETFEIRSETVEKSRLSSQIVPFLSSLVRVRDLELLSRENVRSTFREDFLSQSRERLEDFIIVDEEGPVTRDFSEFPPDLVFRPKAELGRYPAAIYLINSNDKLNEALLAWQEMQIQNRSDFKVIGVIEDAEMKGISRKKFQRAQNRRLPMPIFRGDEDSAVSMVAKEMGLTSVH